MRKNVYAVGLLVALAVLGCGSNVIPEADHRGSLGDPPPESQAGDEGNAPDLAIEQSAEAMSLLREECRRATEAAFSVEIEEADNVFNELDDTLSSIIDEHGGAIEFEDACMDVVSVVWDDLSQPAERPSVERLEYDDHPGSWALASEAGIESLQDELDAQLGELLWKLGITPSQREAVVSELDGHIRVFDEEALFADFILEESVVNGQTASFLTLPLCINYVNGHQLGTRDFDAVADQWQIVTDMRLSLSDQQLLTAIGVTYYCPDAAHAVDAHWSWGRWF